jgi:hypothetical protein
MLLWACFLAFRAALAVLPPEVSALFRPSPHAIEFIGADRGDIPPSLFYPPEEAFYSQPVEPDAPSPAALLYRLATVNRAFQPRGDEQARSVLDLLANWEASALRLEGDQIVASRALPAALIAQAVDAPPADEAGVRRALELLGRPASPAVPASGYFAYAGELRLPSDRIAQVVLLQGSKGLPEGVAGSLSSALGAARQEVALQRQLSRRLWGLFDRPQQAALAQGQEWPGGPGGPAALVRLARTHLAGLWGRRP